MSDDGARDADKTVRLVCQECGRPGEVKPRVVDVGTHRVAIEETDEGTLIQWQEWDGCWFCHTCLADFAADDPEQHYPEADQGGEPSDE